MSFLKQAMSFLNGSRPNGRKRLPARPTRHLSVESLEAREVPAAYTFSGGAAADTILLQRDPANPLLAQVQVNGAWTTVETVTENRKRLRRHAVGTRSVSAVRVRVTATNGGANADIVALRAFAR